MGTTGSGKSTIANGFGNLKVVANEDKNIGEIRIIGEGIANTEKYGSETKIPR